MKRLLDYSIYVLSFIFFFSCNLSNEVSLDLPDPEPTIVVECYLEPGEPYRLLLTRNQAFFDDFPDDLAEYYDDISVDDAQISIFRNGTEIALPNQESFDFDFFKIFNYTSSEIVPYDTISEFELSIRLTDGTHITSSTTILPYVTIDSVIVETRLEREDGMDSVPKSRILTYVTDDPSTKNYLRRMLHWNSLDSVPEQDFTTRDDILENSQYVFGTGYFYNAGDTMFNTIFHISREYYDYQNSIFASIEANFNPFAPPGLVESNVESDGQNAIGIFTGLTYVRDTTIIDN